MFTLFDPQLQKYPIKVWLENENQLEEECLKQAKNLSNLPFIHKWVALMPDAHSGYGMPIGGVIATEQVIIPKAVGVDIGCGMEFVQTDIPVEILTRTETPNGKLAQAILGDILRNIPTGFEHHSKKQTCSSVVRFKESLTQYQFNEIPTMLLQQLDDAQYQIGTLGSGNHFIELQSDDHGNLGIMVHSGSRNLGFKICNYYNNKAKELNSQEKSSVLPEWDLAYLYTESETGKDYIRWMDLALDFARENRRMMLERVENIVQNLVRKYTDIDKIELSEPVSCHHNYASLEKHYGKTVWVHRKGAIRAAKNEQGIVPGAMGTYSYIIEGKGNPESFESCSHGAGRCMSRTDAKEKFSVQETVNDLKSLGVFLGKAKKSDVGEESRFAYKEIDFVIANETDLIEIRKRLKTVAVVKG